ncbi:hypothetical protein BV20DRAFT_659326 [Pilatotrama ljubarskyi]|nr:hypothetical protein BV20DRAFT_659326 [Pilatotrama ljubarskyi]
MDAPIPSSSTQYYSEHDQTVFQGWSVTCADDSHQTFESCGHTASSRSGHSYPYYRTATDCDAELSGSYLAQEPTVFDCNAYSTPYSIPPASDAAVYYNSTSLAASASPQFPLLGYAHEQWYMHPPFPPESFPSIGTYTPLYQQVAHPATTRSPCAATQSTSDSSSLAGALSVGKSVPWTMPQPSTHLPHEMPTPATQPSPHTVHTPAHTPLVTRNESQGSPLWSPSSPDSLHSASSPSSRHSSESPQFCRAARIVVSTTPRRNAAVASSASRHAATSLADKYRCPYCDHVQQNKLSGQLKRHIATHTRPTDAAEQPWVCCGVPLIEAQQRGIPAELLLKEPVEYEGIFFVGGCWKTFSRRDALGRHLRRNAGRCYGDSLASYLPGNKKEQGQ